MDRVGSQICNLVATISVKTNNLAVVMLQKPERHNAGHSQG